MGCLQNNALSLKGKQILFSSETSLSWSVLADQRSELSGQYCTAYSNCGDTVGYDMGSCPNTVTMNSEG